MIETVRKKLSFPSSTQSLKEIREFVRATLQVARLDERGRRFVILGIDEAVTNIVTYRSQGPGEAEIVVSIEIEDTRVRVVIEDRGVDPDLGTLALPAMEKALKTIQTRCVGIFLLRQVVDEVTYRYKKGFQNELELIKFTS